MISSYINNQKYYQNHPLFSKIPTYFNYIL